MHMLVKLPKAFRFACYLLVASIVNTSLALLLKWITITIDALFKFTNAVEMEVKVVEPRLDVPLSRCTLRHTIELKCGYMYTYLPSYA